MGNDEKTKMLNLMRFWLFGTFLIIFAATTVYAGMVSGLATGILSLPAYWYAIVTTAVLCVVWYYVYRWYLNRK